MDIFGGPFFSLSQGGDVAIPTLQEEETEA